VDLATGNLLVLLLMSGKSTWNLANSAAVVALNVGLNVVLIPPFGIKGAAVAWTASIVLDCLATLLQVVYFFGIRPFGRTYLTLILGCASCFAAVGGIARLVLGVNAVALVVSAVAGSVLYVCVLRRGRESLALRSLWQALRGSSSQTAPASDRS
jgi:O-antigen/teichoic acid export membrane protein